MQEQNKSSKQLCLKTLNIYRKLSNITKYTKQGFTCIIYNGEIKPFKQNKGYIVSYKTLIKLAFNGWKYGFSHVEYEIKNFRNKTFIVGGWYDKTTKLYYIELNKCFNNKSNALLFAKNNNQKAIWDIENKKEIMV